MLANPPDASVGIGKLGPGVQRPATFRHRLLQFIAQELPRWRDRPDRPSATSETILTSQLCAHLTSAARLAPVWDSLQFRVEEADEINKGRKIDLVPSPCGTTISVEGRVHTDFDSLMPIECKRFPIPKGKDRDEREYVFSRHSSTGGIQRFKEGSHGAAHRLGGMIGYVQEGTTSYWEKTVSGWINDLAQRGEPGWTVKDLLRCERTDAALRLAVFHSSHERQNDLPEIELCHLWMEMN